MFVSAEEFVSHWPKDLLICEFVSLRHHVVYCTMFDRYMVYYIRHLSLFMNITYIHI